MIASVSEYDYHHANTPELGDKQSFSAYLRSPSRVLALVGAGLSAPSGLPTFRGPGEMWREHDVRTLMTP